MFQNRVGIVIQSHFFEKDLRKTFNRRCNYQKLLDFLTADQEGADREKIGFGSYLNNDGRVNDIVRAIYCTSQTIYRGNGQGLEQRNSESHERFLGALRAMNYEVESAYNSIDAHFVLTALQLAQSRAVDTMILLGLTVDHAPLLWAIRSAGIRTMSMFSNSHDMSERIKNSLNWYYNIKVEDGFLTDKLVDHREETSEEPEQLPAQ